MVYWYQLRSYQVVKYAMSIVSLRSLTTIGRAGAWSPAASGTQDIGMGAPARPLSAGGLPKTAAPGAERTPRSPASAAAAMPADPHPRGDAVEPPRLAALIHSELVARAERLRVVAGQLALERGADAGAGDGEATGTLAETIRCAEDLVGELERLAAVAATYANTGNAQGDRVVVHERLQEPQRVRV